MDTTTTHTGITAEPLREAATVGLMPLRLVDWLRAQDDATLTELFRLRPDLGVPPPADMDVLAGRLQVRASIHRACEDLDTVTLAVLEALVIADADRTPVTPGELRRLLGPDVDADTFQEAVARLRARALIWEDITADTDPGEQPIWLVQGVRDVVSRYPGGLGRPASTGPAASPEELSELLASVEPDERRILELLAAGPPIGRSSLGDPTSPVARLLARGLLVRLDAETVELPRQVGLALRGERPLGRIAAHPPELPTHQRGVETVDGTAATAALEVLRLMDRLLRLWETQPPHVLRSGGLGVRGLRRTARDLQVDEAVAALLVELAAAADLIGESEDAPREWVPTTTADVWAAGGPEVRWALLARTWLEMNRVPGLVGQRDEANRPINALSSAASHFLAAQERHRVLAVLAELPPGIAVGSPSALADLLAWRAPRRAGRLRDAVAWTLAEATVLGVVALDALSTPGRVLLDNPEELPGALRAALPPPVDHILVQADLTAVAPGPLEPVLEQQMALIADVESAGGATVYRFSEQSIRRALDAGHSAGEIHALLDARSATPVPQSLRYLIDDVARRYGRLRGGAASSFLRSDDEVLVAEVMAHPVAARLELRRIAPTVAVSPLPLPELIEGLREAGFPAAAENTDGHILDLGLRGRRTAPRGTRLTAGRRSEPSPAHAEAVVARLRAGDTVAGVRTRVGEPSSNGTSFASDTVAMLREAARSGRHVRIGFVDRHGTSTAMVLQPTKVEAGVVAGRDSLDGDLHRVPLHRITTVALVEDPPGGGEGRALEPNPRAGG